MSETNYLVIRQLLDDILKIDRNELRNLRDLLNRYYHSNEPILVQPWNKKKLLGVKKKSKDKLELIGSLPFVLLDKKYFPDNKTLVTFAQEHLNIKIPFAHKRSRNEIIGTIIAEVSEKDQRQISVFTQALNKILGKHERGKIKNFFLEWNKVISET